MLAVNEKVKVSLGLQSLLHHDFLNSQGSLHFNVKRRAYFGEKKLFWTVGKKLVLICVGSGQRGAFVKYLGWAITATFYHRRGIDYV